MAKQVFDKPHPVSSSNLKNIQFRPGTGPKQEDVIRINFQRIGSVPYDYFPCTKEEFEAGKETLKISDWFNDLKTGKNFKAIK